MIVFAAFFLAQAGQPAAANPPIAFPHPLITEVLYAVPTGPAGDANGDGTREVNGDEFVELVNPHDKPIQLAGYTIADRELEKNGKKFTSLRFKFPTLELKPGEVVVVFNGHKQKWKGPVGNSSEAPASGNEHFHGARILSMAIAAGNQGFANKGDCVQLIAPDGAAVHCITWGDASTSQTAAKVETAPLVSKESVQRTTLTGAMEPFHVSPDAGDRSCSPGAWPPRRSEAAPSVKPAERSQETKPEAK